MLFLFLRFLPYIIPVFYFAAIRGVFAFNDYWPWFLASMLIFPAVYFLLLKLKNRGKKVLLLGAFALLFAVSGFAYALILENQYVINLYLLVWSLIYGLYLEAVFHDFYETSKSYVLNLKNIAVFGGILTVFFLTAALNSFNIFLSLAWFILLPALALAYAIVTLLIVARNQSQRRRIWLYSGVIVLIMIETVSLLTLLPCSFYVIAIIATLAYYTLISLALSEFGGAAGKKELWRYLVFAAMALLLIVITANWL